MLLKRHTWLVVALQALLIFICLVAAWLLRFEFRFRNLDVLLKTAPLLLVLRLAAMRRYNLFHGYWRYTGINDAADIARAIAMGSAGFFIVVRLILGLTSFPLSIYVLEALLTGGTLGGVRLLSRIVLNSLQRPTAPSRTRVLVVGAGAAAAALIRELSHSPYEIVGCVDDDLAKHGIRLNGIKIVGGIDHLPQFTTKLHADEIFIAMPSIVGARRRRIIELCQQSGKKFKTIPGLRDLVEGRVKIGQLREVDVEDLLGREPVRLDLEAVRRHIEDRVAMVTGAAGSIGQELCRQILTYHPAKLICVDQAETPLFYLELNLKQFEEGHKAVYCVADITDSKGMRSILHKHRVEAIFNAAAYKHVPMMECNVGEAIRNNVYGLITLLRAAEDEGCEDFLLISSDKAVNPTSLMGATKRLGELILASRPSKMRCISVRFGNVLGSQGSVVPVFQRQIREQGRVTVTHPEITRYLMTIPEAVSLVLQAFTLGTHGDILVLDMGEPIRILDLAKTLIRLSDLSEKDVPIIFTGLRPGEKLYEELFYKDEVRIPTPHEKVNRTHSALGPWELLSRELQELESLIQFGTEQSIRSKIRELIPEYAYELTLEPTSPVPFTHNAQLDLSQAAVAND